MLSFRRPNRTVLLARWLLVPATTLALMSLSGIANAHVDFLNPQFGDQLEPGATVNLIWEDTIAHDTVGYSLTFRANETSEPVVVFADLPATEKSYEWQAPEQPCESCELKLTQLNETDLDYSVTLVFSVIEEGTAGTGGGSANGTGGRATSGTGGESPLDGSGGDTAATGGAFGTGGGDAPLDMSDPLETSDEEFDTMSSSAGCSWANAKGAGPRGPHTPSLSLIASLGLLCSALFRRRKQDWIH